MKGEYFCKKHTVVAKNVQEAQIFFANSDYFTLNKKEIVDLKVVFYDELRVGELGFCPIAKSGYIKCRINDKRRRNGEQLLYQNDEYGKDIKEYLEKRCVKEGGIRYVRLFDKNSWHVPFYCFATARIEDDYLVLEFQEGVGYGSADNDKHVVRARNVNKDNIRKISLEFENCENIDIFPNEILDIDLNFEKELQWGAGAFNREVRNGFIRLKFDKEIEFRHNFLGVVSGKNNIKKLESRLCRKSRETIDICHLYVTYDYVGYGTKFEENIEIKDIRPIREQEEDEWGYVSGYAQREKDGSILIVFGK